MSNNNVDAYELVHIDSIKSDPSQVRKSFHNIRELADTIKKNGLLQNLVLRRGVSSVQGSEEPSKLYIVAGERRYRAILLLIEEDSSFDKVLLCLIKGNSSKADNIFVMLCENDAREAVPPWRTGYKYQELLDFGFTQGEIAAGVGKNNSHVSVCLNIARGIHPDITAILDRVPNSISSNKLLSISKMLNASFEPDLEKQREALTAALRHKARKTGRPRDNISEKERVIMRYGKLKAGRVKIPTNAQAFFDSIMRYLSGVEAKITYNGSEIEI